MLHGVDETLVVGRGALLTVCLVLVCTWPLPREIWYPDWSYTQTCTLYILSLLILLFVFLWTFCSTLPDSIDQWHKLQAEFLQSPPELCPGSFLTHPPFTSHTHRLLSPCAQGNWSSLSLIQGQWAPWPFLLERKKVQWTVGLSYLASRPPEEDSHTLAITRTAGNSV